MQIHWVGWYAGAVVSRLREFGSSIHMGKFENVLAAILRGTSDSNIAFAELRYALEELGFTVRIKGDHFIYTKQGVQEIVNLQPLGSKAKAYQVKQVRVLILKYKLAK